MNVVTAICVVVGIVVPILTLAVGGFLERRRLHRMTFYQPPGRIRLGIDRERRP